MRELCVQALSSLCPHQVTGVDFSAGMLAQARTAHPQATLVQADVRALRFSEQFDLAVSFGALGHFLPAERPALFHGVYGALRPGGLFAFPVGGQLPRTSLAHWATLGFDVAMRVRNAVWQPPFIMYYRTGGLPEVTAELTDAGFTTSQVELSTLGRHRNGSPRGWLILARKPTRCAPIRRTNPPPPPRDFFL